MLRVRLKRNTHNVLSYFFKFLSEVVTFRCYSLYSRHKLLFFLCFPFQHIFQLFNLKLSSSPFSTFFSRLPAQTFHLIQNYQTTAIMKKNSYNIFDSIVFTLKRSLSRLFTSVSLRNDPVIKCHSLLIYISHSNHQISHSSHSWAMAGVCGRSVCIGGGKVCYDALRGKTLLCCGLSICSQPHLWA